MTTAFVTGATGFVGNAVARSLLASGRQVRVLARKTSNLKLLGNLKVEIAEGDLRDGESLREALRGCDELYHVAAQYTFFNPKPQEIYESNVLGTQNILRAALENNLKKVVYTSTVGAVGIPRDGGWGDEETPITLFDCKGHYKRSKFLAEQEAFSFFRKGLPLVIVNPSAPVGARDIKPTPTGKMIVDFLNRKMPAYLDTGLNLVDVDDVAQGHLLAAEKGLVGHRYILGNKNMSLQQILQELSALTGLKAPKVKIPHGFALMMAHFSETISKVTKKPPMVEVEAVQLGKKRMYFNPEKAVRDLDLPQTEVRIALQKAIDWFLDHGYVKAKMVERIRQHQSSLPPLTGQAALESDS